MGSRYRDIVQAHSQAKRGSRAILNIIANYANSDGIATPGDARIASDAGVSTRTVERQIRELVKLGEIKVLAGGNGRGKVRKILITLCDKTRQVDDLSTDIKPDSLANKTRQVDVQNPTNADSSLYIEPDLEPKEEPDLLLADAQKLPTPQQQYFQKICDIIGWDHKAITKADSGRVAQASGILRKAGYTLDDLCRFGRDVWAKDWRWQKHRQRPTLNDLRQEIGKLRAVDEIPEPTDNSRAPTSKVGRSMAAVDRVVAMMKAQEAQAHEH